MTDGQSEVMERSMEMALNEPIDRGPIKHITPMEADVSFRERYVKAVTSDRWMAAAWNVEDGMVNLVGITTSNFPSGDFPGAVQLLNQELLKFGRINDNPPEPEPLPMAENVEDTA